MLKDFKEEKLDESKKNSPNEDDPSIVSISQNSSSDQTLNGKISSDGFLNTTDGIGLQIHFLTLSKSTTVVWCFWPASTTDGIDGSQQNLLC